MASSNSGYPVISSGSIGLTVTSVASAMAGGGTATVLSSAQATQLLSKLRSMNSSGTVPQTIKIQAIQTNPQTGVKQIVAIPIQSASGSKVNVSPMKVIRMPASMGAGTQYAQVVTTSSAGTSLSRVDGIPHGVKVVKLAPGPITSNAQQYFQTRVVTPNKSSMSNSQSVMQNSHQQQMNVVTSHQSMASRGSVGGSSDVIVETGSHQIKRNRSDIDFESFSDAKRRKTEKGGKGLRHFSMKVCEKVQAKGSTSYNEVADELVNELTDPRCTSPTDQQYDQKNIRRRVYDALNVLMAMNIISKEKKEIRWLGLPTNSVQEANSLELDKTKRIERIKAKTQQLQDLILQQIAFKNLVERNKEREKCEGAPAPNSAIQLPFIIVNTSKKTVIDCSISNDKMEYLFNFDDTFELHDDMEVLKRMGLSLGLERGQVSPEDLAKARAMLPRALEQYVSDLAKNGLGSCAGIPRVSSPKILKEETLDIVDGHSEDRDSDSEVDIS